MKLSGYCAGGDTNNSKAEFKANWKKQGRRKQLTMSFEVVKVFCNNNPILLKIKIWMNLSFK